MFARGFTLVETLVGVMIVAIALSTLPLAVTFFARSGANPFVQQQAIALAESYMREILGSGYTDTATPSPFCMTPASNPDKASGRAVYDNLCDYDVTNDTPPRFPSGVDLTGSVLARFRVQVALTCPATAGCSVAESVSLGPAADPVSSGSGAIPDLVQISVTVTDPAGQAYRLVAYRARHPQIYTPPLGFSWYQVA